MTSRRERRALVGFEAILMPFEQARSAIIVAAALLGCSETASSTPNGGGAGSSSVNGGAGANGGSDISGSGTNGGSGGPVTGGSGGAAGLGTTSGGVSGSFPGGAGSGAGSGNGGNGGASGSGGIGDGGKGYVPGPSSRTLVPLSGSWKFSRSDVTGASSTTFDDTNWSTVTVPHTWNATDGQDGGNDYYRGVGWYRRGVAVPAEAQGKDVFLQFDGSNIVTDVYVNGMLAGQHRGGFGRFRFDVTRLVTPGADAVVAVKVSNAAFTDVPPLSGDFTFFGGIYRDVSLFVTDKLHVDVEHSASSGVYLDTSAVTASSATLRSRVRVRNNRSAAETVTVDTVVVDAMGTVAGRLSASGSVAAGATSELAATSTFTSPHLWNGVTAPYLYTAYAEVRAGGALIDWVAQPLGFRSFTVDAARGFTLNGAYLDLHGVNRHQDRLNMGWALGKAQHDEDFALIREVGANTVRLAHYPHAEYVYDLTDRLGLVTWAEIPLVNAITDSTAFTNNAREQLLEMIRQHYNHPSIVFWGLANEERGKPDPNTLITALNTLAHTEDPSRPTTQASAQADAAALNWRTDLVGFNKYYGWYDAASTVNDFAPWLDAIHQARPTARVSVSEYGAGASIGTHTASPVPRDHSEEYQNLFHETYWKALASRPFIWGKYVWNMFDFAADDRAEGDARGRNDKGLVTYDRRTRKDAFFWYQANWTIAPMVYVTSRRFTRRTQASTTIKVYSNAPSVEVRLNGTSLGSKSSSDHIFSWNATLRAGSNTVEAIGSSGGLTVTDSVTWTLD
jgi:beta-galactosidase